MNDIDRYLDQACRQINGPDSLRQHLRNEFKEHLEEAIDALVAEGMSRDDATSKAIEELGDPESIRDGMQSVYGPSVTSLFVEQAIKWKDRRWHRLAQIGLVLNIVLTISFFYLAMLWIVPGLVRDYHELDKELPGFMQATFHVSRVAVHYWGLWLIALAAAVGFFEWKCKSESKTSIRTFILVGLLLVSVVGAFWVGFVTMASFAILPS